MTGQASAISVLLLSRYDRLGASSRLRFLDFLPTLRAAGIAVTPAPLFDDAYLRDLYAGRRPDMRRIASLYARRLKTLLDARRFDLVWLEKEALPWLPAWAETALLGRVPYVMDLDDAWFHRYGRHRSGMVRGLLGGKLEALARGARLILAGSPYLAEWAQHSGAPDVRMMPTVIDLDRYPTPSPAPGGQPLTIGWMGSSTTARYLERVGGALARLKGATRLRVVGGGALALPGVEVETRPWREEDEARELAGFDIGIMPLPDEPWERGKCGYKLIQYMAAGRPVVASPVGVNTTLVQDGVNGFLAADEAGWVAALRRLAEDGALRNRMGAEGRRMVEERYSLQAVTPRLIQALRSSARPPLSG
ncbi:glycosyltransferase family 4 protein [Azospirillum doebereinerae]